MDKERILITVKTYPTLSKKYGETVCTAGVRPDGTWVRMYPVPFRRLGEPEQYSKYDWIECRVARNATDKRPESFRPLDTNELRAVGHIGTQHEWADRRSLLLRTARVYDRLDQLTAAAHANTLSLAVFKPNRVLDFAWQEDERAWEPDRVRQFREASKQLDLFEDNAWRETFRLVDKLPYKFSYAFEDATGTQSKLTILDWEIGALFWNCLKSSDCDEDRALTKVRQMYWDQFTTKDLHFFLGTTLAWHSVAPNPFLIVGVLPIPHERQRGLF